MTRPLIAAAAFCSPSPPPARRPPRRSGPIPTTTRIWNMRRRSSRLNIVPNQPGNSVKMFAMAGGDPAMNGLQTYLAFYADPDEGWVIFRIGDFLDYRILSATRRADQRAGPGKLYERGRDRHARAPLHLALDLGIGRRAAGHGDHGAGALGPFTPDAAGRAQDRAMKTMIPLLAAAAALLAAPAAIARLPGTASPAPADCPLTIGFSSYGAGIDRAASRPSSACSAATAPSAPSPAIPGAARARSPCACAPAPPRTRAGCSTRSARCCRRGRAGRSRSAPGAACATRRRRRDLDRKPPALRRSAMADRRRRTSIGAMRAFFILAAILCISARAPAPGWHLVPGSLEPNRGPDGNSVFLDAPAGLILIDTGRHPAHRDRLLA